MTRVLIATQNSHKIEEYRQILTDLGALNWLSLSDVGLHDMQVAETGTTFATNATLKAEAYGQRAGVITLADDSGLVVEALDGAPGVYSARYGAPEVTTDQGRYELLLRNLHGITERQAYFVCVIAIFVPGKATHTVEGRVYGDIGHQPRGHNGFGYDPVFMLENGYSLAELSPDDKHEISHRGQALRHALPYLDAVINTGT